MPKSSAPRVRAQGTNGRRHIVMATQVPVLPPGRPGPLEDGAGAARDARLAPGQRRLRQPHRPSLRLQPADRLSLAGPLRPPSPREPRGPQRPAAAPAPPDLDDWPSCRAVKAVRERYPRWGKDKLAVLLRREGIRMSVSMVGRILGRLLRIGRPARAGTPADGRPAHGPGRGPGRSAGRPTGSVRATGRPGRARHPRHPAAARPGLEAVHGPGRGQSRWDVARARSPGERPGCRGSILDRARRADALPGPGHQHRQRLRVHGRLRGRLRGPGHPPVRPATPLAQAPRRRRAGQPDPHRGVLRGHRRGARPRGPSRPALREWEAVYNTIRPHQALGYLTPAEYLASVGIDV